MNVTRRLRELPRHWTLLLVATLLAGAAVPATPRFATNLVWLAVAAQAADPTRTVAPAPPLLTYAAGTPRGSQALGILAANAGDEATAQAAWARAGDPDQLLAIGLNAERAGQRDLALLYYRSAGEEPYSPGWFAAGRVCQRSLGEQERLHPDNRVRCKALFRANDNNLILNGDWREGGLDGWQYLGALPEIESAGPYAPSAALIGHRRERRSIYQSIVLPPDTLVRFRALVRREAGPLPSRLSLLQVTFTQPNGASAGHALNGLELLATPDEWRTVERTYRTRPAQGNLFRFTPVLIEGEGRVLVDQVHLEIIESP